MKKLLLIPITLTALAPAISLVGCNRAPIQINVNIDASGSYKNATLESEPFSIQLNAPYQFNVDLSKDTTCSIWTEYITILFTKKEPKRIPSLQHYMKSIHLL